jgi:hypothetical protein
MPAGRPRRRDAVTYLLKIFDLGIAQKRDPPRIGRRWGTRGCITTKRGIEGTVVVSTAEVEKSPFKKRRMRRRCLRCRKEFWSYGPGHRLCLECDRANRENLKPPRFYRAGTDRGGNKNG